MCFTIPSLITIFILPSATKNSRLYNYLDKILLKTSYYINFNINFFLISTLVYYNTKILSYFYFFFINTHALISAVLQLSKKSHQYQRSFNAHHTKLKPLFKHFKTYIPKFITYRNFQHNGFIVQMLRKYEISM